MRYMVQFTERVLRQRHEIYGSSSSLLKELKDKDVFQFIELDCTHFEDLLKIAMKKAISVATDGYKKKEEVGD